jgi:hypothetical protein
VAAPLAHRADGEHEAVSYRRFACIVVSAVLVLMAVLGIVFAYGKHVPKWLGLLRALASGTTVGSAVAPSTHLGYLVGTARLPVLVS